MMILALVALALALASITEGVGEAFAPRVVVVEEENKSRWGSFVVVLSLTIAAAAALAGLSSGVWP